MSTTTPTSTSLSRTFGKPNIAEAIRVIMSYIEVAIIKHQLGCKLHNVVRLESPAGAYNFIFKNVDEPTRLTQMVREAIGSENVGTVFDRGVNEVHITIFGDQLERESRAIATTLQEGLYRRETFRRANQASSSSSSSSSDYGEGDDESKSKSRSKKKPVTMEAIFTRLLTPGFAFIFLLTLLAAPLIMFISNVSANAHATETVVGTSDGTQN